MQSLTKRQAAPFASAAKRRLLRWASRRIASDQKLSPKNGDIKLDVPPMDILRAVVGLSAYASPGWEKNATRMIDILLVGMAKD